MSVDLRSNYPGVDLTYRLQRPISTYLVHPEEPYFGHGRIGWQISDRITKDLVIKAFLKAYWSRKSSKGLIHHSDRGSQYTSNDFQNLLTNTGARISHSGKGNCFDNAMVEYFFHSLKTELDQEYLMQTKTEAKSTILSIIEAFYNSKRRHSALNYCSPNDFKQYSTRVA